MKAKGLPMSDSKRFIYVLERKPKGSRRWYVLRADVPRSNYPHPRKTWFGDSGELYRLMKYVPIKETRDAR